MADPTTEDLLNAAQARKYTAEATKLEYEALTAERVYRATVLDLTQREHAHKSWEARAKNRTIYFSGDVEPFSVSRAMDALTEYSLTDPGCDIDIVINSPGGEIVEGLALFDHIQIIRRRGHKVTTMALGMAASMGGVLLQAGDVRVMSKESWLMLHEAAFGARGKTSTVEDTTEWVKRMQDRLLDIFASRSNLSKAQLRQKWSRKDWWLSSDEALKFGLIDEVR